MPLHFFPLYTSCFAINCLVVLLSCDCPVMILSCRALSCFYYYTVFCALLCCFTSNIFTFALGNKRWGSCLFHKGRQEGLSLIIFLVPFCPFLSFVLVCLPFVFLLSFPSICLSCLSVFLYVCYIVYVLSVSVCLSWSQLCAAFSPLPFCSCANQSRHHDPCLVVTLCIRRNERKGASNRIAKYIHRPVLSPAWHRPSPRQLTISLP